MSDAQAALEAASRIHQRVEGKFTSSSNEVLVMADSFLSWLNSKG